MHQLRSSLLQHRNGELYHMKRAAQQEADEAAAYEAERAHYGDDL